MPDPTTDKLLDRIEVLESALKEIEALPSSAFSPFAFNNKESIFWKIHQIATKALWPVLRKD